MLSFLIYYII